MLRQDILTTAGDAIDGDRDRAYGSAHDNWQRIAAMWSQILGVDVTPAQTGLCMIAVKVSRLINTPAHDDSWVDLAGYAALGGEVAAGRTDA
jgi:hypothetical protein